ncbi:MAG: response regulator transcription factor [Chlorobiaceae bacterium]|nr:response regulator transcription factor [Chlorobiaceae bacterium]
MNQQQERNALDFRVAIVDGDQVFREAMVDFLKLQGYQTEGFGSAGEFYQQLLSARYDLMIVDFGLNDQGGLLLCEYVRKNTEAYIIMLCPVPEIDTRLAAYASGADFCLVKPIDSRELAALSANLSDRMERFRSKICTVPPAVEKGSAESVTPWKLFRSDWSLHTPKGDAVSLTAKEYDFLLSLVLQSTAIVTRQYILKILGYQPDDKGNRALESLIYRLRKKIGETGCGFPIKTYRGLGYCLASPVVLS